MPITLRLLSLAFVLAIVCTAGARDAAAQEGWVIREFDVRYTIEESGEVAVVEDILVDFGDLQRHGIFRTLPVEYAFDDESNRRIDIEDIMVDDGERPHPVAGVSELGPNLEIKIGDPDVFVSGMQRYRIHYTIVRGLNPFPDHDEFYWNVTGSMWPVGIESASAVVDVARPGISRVTCFQGPVGSTDPCQIAGGDESVAAFRTSQPLAPGSDFTVVVGLEKGLVSVGPPVLVDANRTPLEQAEDFFGFGPVPVALSIGVLVFVALVLARLWWLVGRDRWFGHAYYETETPHPERLPFFASEPVVVEYQPPAKPDGARIRPAEVGLLLDERADTLDVSATIVDLAVRGYLRIEEVEGGLFGLGEDYRLTRLREPDGDLLPYERELLSSLFTTGDEVKLSDLKEEFHESLARVKEALYTQSVKVDGFFPRDPDGVRGLARMIGAGVAVAGGLVAFALGSWFGAGLVAVPVVLGGVVVFVLHSIMPRRSARGRQMYRRCLGLRLYMTAGDQGRERFAEQANIFEEYLPYAIVFKSARRWAEVFEELGIEPRVSEWYISQRPFDAMAFAGGVREFSSSMSSVMAATPGGSGGSGFSGGGSSGGGGGGGGGGSW